MRFFDKKQISLSFIFVFILLSGCLFFSDPAESETIYGPEGEGSRVRFYNGLIYTGNVNGPIIEA
jgi:hypothetical protein